MVQLPMALNQRLFRRYFCAVTLSSVGTYASGVALTFGILDLGSIKDLSWILISRELPLVVLVLAGGVYADRMNKARLLAGCFLVQTVSQMLGAFLLMGTLSPRGSLTVWLSLLAAVNGSAAAFCRPATTALIPQIVVSEALESANALLGVSKRLVGVGGALLGAGLIGAVGPGMALLLDAATFLVAGVLLSGLAGPGRASSSGRHGSAVAEFKEGFREVARRDWLCLTILSFSVFQLCFFPAIMVLGPIVTKENHGGASAWAAIVSAELVGGVLGGILVMRLRIARPLVWVNLASLPIVVELLALAYHWNMAVLFVAAMAGGAGVSLSDAVWYTTLQRRIPAEALSRVSSFDWLGSIALNPLGYLLVGPVVAAIGVRGTLVGAAAALGVVCMLPLTRASVTGVDRPNSDAEPATPQDTAPGDAVRQLENAVA